jgi:hypothetical protein
MATLPLLAGLVCLLSAAGAEPAAGGPSADTYTAGLACFERLDFPCAIELLEAAKLQPGRSKETLSDIHRKLAESYVAQDKRDRAVQEFVELLKLNPAFDFQSPGTSPKIIDALQEARKKLEPVRAEPPLPDPWLEMSLQGGAELLVGTDSDLLDIGPIVELGADFVLSGPWRLGAGLRYTFHDVSGDSSTVHLGGGWVTFGGSWNLGLLYLGAAAGVGVGHFGIPDQEGKTALLIPTRIYLNFPVLPNFQVGLLFSPALVVTMDDEMKSSFTMGVGGRFCLVF